MDMSKCEFEDCPHPISPLAEDKGIFIQRRERQKNAKEIIQTYERKIL